MIDVDQSIWTQTPEKVFHKLQMPFHMEKKTLKLATKPLIGSVFFFGGGGGSGDKCKAIWRIERTSEKILTTPLEIILITLRTMKLERSIDLYLYFVFKFVFSYFLISFTVNSNVIYI